MGTQKRMRMNLTRFWFMNAAMRIMQCTGSLGESSHFLQKSECRSLTLRHQPAATKLQLDPKPVFGFWNRVNTVCACVGLHIGRYAHKVARN